MKAQWVRVADVVFVGPLMLYAATLLPKRHQAVAGTLGLLGAATVLYNGRNYLLTAQESAPPREKIANGRGHG